MYTPSRRIFRSLSKLGRRVPVAACLPLERTAQEIFQAVDYRSPSVLLESARLHPATGRYSIIVGEPSFTLTSRKEQIVLEDAQGSRFCAGSPLQVLQRFLDAQPAHRMPHFPPFVGGAVGYFGFDACRYLEGIPSRAEDDLCLPDFSFLFVDEAVVVDHLLKKLWVIALADPSEDPERTYDDAVGRIDALLLRVTQSLAAPRSATSLDCCAVPRRSVASTHTRASFEKMVREAKEFIAAGEIYQANLSQRFSMPLADRPWDMYRRLTALNPSPFAAYADFGIFQVISASPERLLRFQGQVAETRPIAGTRPRGKTAGEMARLRRELMLNEKERAEHLMLVDLERNDLGRVCRLGSVRVDELMTTENYSHVIHIVSNVRGIVRSGVRPSDLVAAVFPGGTITGCPKIRCLEIIDSLEPVRRHLYTGSMGYVSSTGEMDMNILIRTGLTVGETVYVQAGAGIVADSDPAREYDETVHKAGALMEAFDAEAPATEEMVGGPVGS